MQLSKCMLGLVWLAVWASPASAGGAPADLDLQAGVLRPLELEQVASGVFYHPGTQAEETTTNQGDIANVGFVVGDRCVAVVDTGGSPAVGRALHAAIRERTALPICYVINTHMHPDHVFGNAAFVQDDPVFVAADGFRQALAARARTYLDRLAEDLDEPTDSSWIVMPDRVVEDSFTIDLGDRVLQIRAWPSAHTDNDLTIFDQSTGTLWLGDLAFVDRVPAIDGSITGWLSALGELRKREDVIHAIPGHGPASSRWPGVLDNEQRYFIAIRDGVTRAIDDGRSLRWAEDHVAGAEREHWLLFDDYHARNVTAAYTELEWQ